MVRLIAIATMPAYCRYFCEKKRIRLELRPAGCVPPLFQQLESKAVPDDSAGRKTREAAMAASKT
jgi:hypothetical protein